jgi:NADPH-dependent curcumin reductase CurA
MPRQIILASRPSGWPTADNFALAEADRPDLADGQVRVRLLCGANTGKMLVRL